jgi:hypothetical protein
MADSLEAGIAQAMDAFAAEELLAGLEPGRHDFAGFFRPSTLSLTVARWPAGSADDQQPHTERTRSIT